MIAETGEARLPIGIIDSRASDPMRRWSTLEFLGDSLAGDVDTRTWCDDAGDAAVVGFDFTGTRVPLTFDLAKLLGASDDGIGRRWLVLGASVRFRHTLYGDGSKLAPLMERIHREARLLGYDGIVVPWVDVDDEDRQDLLGQLGYRAVFYDADWYVDCAGRGDLEELIASMPRTARKQFTNDRNRFALTGTRFRDWRAGDERFALGMHRDFMSDYGHERAEFRDEAFARFASLPGATIRVAEDESGRLVGYVMALRDDSTMHVLRWGRPSGDVPDRLYANLGYLDPLMQATRAGVDRVWLGKNAHRFKQLRGLIPVPATFNFLALDPERHAGLAPVAAAADAAARSRYESALEL
ncbi:hypothetical protein [Clavibacter sp. VKM Ac-2872]|uniref:hypothetical protein n=1 Tax=Clavibacter sp. VKM Ac-2872 TaxID=2783812 RepID=UPI00188B383C|nr:hypothetical protein [Clavibacter sp. VKM Ac-2872]MBF4622764.1 hypothetical protein [Clavibacter sp. VKM Ac-2872]